MIGFCMDMQDYQALAKETTTLLERVNSELLFRFLRFNPRLANWLQISKNIIENKKHVPPYMPQYLKVSVTFYGTYPQ